MADMSNLSFSSPVPPRRGGTMGRLPGSPPDDEDLENDQAADETVQAVDEDSLPTDETPEDDDDDSDPTVKLRPPSPKPVSLSVEDAQSRTASVSPPATPAPVTETPDPHKRHKVRVTTELEHIVVRASLVILQPPSQYRPRQRSGPPSASN